MINRKPKPSDYLGHTPDHATRWAITWIYDSAYGLPFFEALCRSRIEFRYAAGGLRINIHSYHVHLASALRDHYLTLAAHFQRKTSLI